MKVIGFFHDDLDGAGCTTVFNVAHQHMGEDAKIVNCSNSNVDVKVTQEIWGQKPVDPDIMICFGDICPTRTMLEKLATEFDNIWIWDHHKTNLFAKEVIENAKIVPEPVNGKLESGTSLMYQYYVSLAKSFSHDKRGLYFNNPANHQLLKSFVDTVRSYDTYEWKETNNFLAKKLQTLYNLLGMDRFVRKYTARLTDLRDSNVLIEEQDLTFIDSKVEQEQRSIDAVSTDDVYVRDITKGNRGYKCALKLSTGGMNISELSYQFLSKHPEFDIFIGINLGSGDLQYRTIKDDIDTGAIFAKPGGGGGHPKASGSPIPEQLQDNVIAAIVDHISEEAGWR